MTGLCGVGLTFNGTDTFSTLAGEMERGGVGKRP